MQPLPIEPSPMRMRVETREGVLVVYDAAAPPEADEGCSGYIGYWLSVRDKTQYVFPVVLQVEGDLGAVLLALERDLGVDLEALADRDDRIDMALRGLPIAPNEEFAWEPATLHRAVEIMGFDPENDPDLNQSGDTQTAAVCQPCEMSLPPAWSCGSPGGLAREAFAVAVNCCCPAAYCPPSCDDNNACTSDYCTCTCGYCWCVNEPRFCNDGSLCTDDSCNPATGCVYEPKNCDDGDVCTRDTCFPDTGCTHNPHCDPQKCCPDGSDYHCCSPPPGDPCEANCCGQSCCYGGSECCNGVCCAPGAVCCDGYCRGGMCQVTEQRCLDPPTCLFTECVVAPACDDGNVCTTDVCTQQPCGDHTCSNTPNTLPCPDDGDPCTLDVCDGLNGFCIHPPGHNGAACQDDGNICTADICNGGVCTHPPGNEAGNCPDEPDPCTDDYCLGGSCVHEPFCPPPCNGCVNYGSLSDGTIAVEPDPACVGSTITFTASGVSDTGGLERVVCDDVPIPAVTPTYTWTMTLPPDYPPPLPPLSGSGASASVEARVPGSYSCTFTATAERECPPDPITIGPATADTCLSASAVAGAGPTCGLTLTIKAITFLGDHQMYENADPGNWGAGEALLPPDWQDVNSADNPICYTRGSPLRMDVVVEIESSGVETPTLRVQGPNGLQGTIGVTSQCGTVQRMVTILTTPLPNYVTRYEAMSLDWSFQRQGETTWTSIASTYHHLFVSYDTPTYDDPVNGGPTQWRMRSLCGAALDADTALEVVDGLAPFGGIGIHTWLAGTPPVDGHDPIQSDAWELMSGFPYQGECDEQARLMVRAVQLIGGPAGTWYNTYPIPHDTCNPDIGGPVVRTAAQAGITWLNGDEQVILRFDFPHDGLPGGDGTNINAFEGSVAYPTLGRYYAVWPSLSAYSKCGLLHQVELTRAVQCWARFSDPWQCVRDPSTGQLKLEPFPVCTSGCP